MLIRFFKLQCFYFIPLALVDFQFLPMEKVIMPPIPQTSDLAVRSNSSSHYAYRSFYNQILPLTDSTLTADWLKWDESERRNSGATEDDVLLFCLPTLFARYVQPGNFEFKSGPNLTSDPSIPPGAIVSCTFYAYFYN